MHVVNIVIEYTLGIKENTKTHKRVVDGKMQKVKEIVTPGGNLQMAYVSSKLGDLFAISSPGLHRERKSWRMWWNATIFLQSW